MGVAVDGSGTVAFIADTHNHRIVQMRLSDGAQVGTAISGVGDFLNGGTALRFPRGVTWAIMQNPNTWWKQDMSEASGARTLRPVSA
jgi:hypothetical protein